MRSLKAVNGNTQDKAKLVEAIARVEFDSPQGRFRFDPKTQNVIRFWQSKQRRGPQRGRSRLRREAYLPRGLRERPA